MVRVRDHTNPLAHSGASEDYFFAKLKFICYFNKTMIAIPIKFQFNIESEVRRVERTLGISEWLTKNNYRFLLPNSIKNFKDAKIETIRKSVEDEYDLKIYQTAESAILKSWEEYSESIKKINQKMIGSYILDELIVVLTRYGNQGSYTPPNSVVINIALASSEKLTRTVIHESIHLMIEHLIKKYSIEHWVKERIVNLIMDIEYKLQFKTSFVPDWALATDAIFKEHYPNLILIIEKAAKISSDK